MHRRLGGHDQHEEQRRHDQIPTIQGKQRHEHIPDEHELTNRPHGTKDEALRELRSLSADQKWQGRMVANLAD